MREWKLQVPIDREATCPVCLGRRLDISTVELAVVACDEPVLVTYEASCPDCNLHIERRPDDPVTWQRLLEAFISADLRALAYLSGGR